MRVVIVAPGLAYDAGAIPIRARLAGENLVRRGHEVLGLGLYSEGLQPVEASFPIEVVRPFQLPRPAASVSCWFNYERLIANRIVATDHEKPIQLVVSHTQTYGILSSRVRAATSARWISVVQRTIYDVLQSGYAGPNWVMNKIMKVGSWRDFTRSDVIVALHPSMAGEIRKFVPNAGRIACIPNGVNQVGANFESLHRSNDSNTILYVGRLEEEKRVAILIRAFGALDGQGAQLIIVGDGEQRGELEALARRMNIADRVSFVGKLSHSETLGWYRKARIFALPSASEGMPFVLLEAMAAGCAIVCSDIPGNRAVVDQTQALIVPVDDVEATAKALSRLLKEHDTSAELARQSHARSAHFYWRQIIDEEVDLYESICSAV